MIAPSKELLMWADVLAKFGQFLFGLITLFLAIYAAILKRKEIFRSELHKKQVGELGEIRDKLQQLLFDFAYIPGIKEDIKTMGWNLSSLKEDSPESWQQYQRFKSNSLELFNKIGNRDYYLFPHWLDTTPLLSLRKQMEKFIPFTLNSVSSKSEENREEFMNGIVQVVNHLDRSLKKNA